MKNLSKPGIRDYIHVMDLADGHVAALEKLQKEHLKIKVRICHTTGNIIGLEKEDRRRN